MEQGRRVKGQEPEKVSVDLNPIRVAEVSVQPPAADQKEDKDEVRAETKMPDKAKIEVASENTI